MANNSHQSRRQARQAPGAGERVPLDAGADAPAAEKPEKPARSAATRTAQDASRAGSHSAALAPEAGERGRDAGGEHGEITRRSRTQRSVDTFAIPDSWKKKGWDFQYWVTTVLGQPVELSAEIYEGGWRPVHWKDVPKPWSPGANANEQIARGGQALYTRPMTLTHQARQEEYNAAEQQKRDRVQSALEGKVSGQEGIADIKGVVPRAQVVTVEGEVGVHSGPKG